MSAELSGPSNLPPRPDEIAQTQGNLAVVDRQDSLSIVTADTYSSIDTVLGRMFLAAQRVSAPMPRGPEGARPPTSRRARLSQISYE
jgi:hypothetical protein